MKGNKCSTLRIALILILFLFLYLFPVSAQYNEGLIKAAYIERITRFLEWPARDSLISKSNFVIGVYDEKEFYSTLTEVFKDKPIKQHKVKIITITGPEDISTCNLCYISGKARPKIRKFIEAANSSGVLIISGTTDFSKEGVHINFYIEDEKLKFEINEKSLASAGFKVSYLLLQNTRRIQ
jgi:hypothetical protein